MAFEALKGQDAAASILLSAFQADRVPHAYLFAGPEGVGKRLAARLWAKILNCGNRNADFTPCDVCPSCRKIDEGTHPDVLWMDFAFQAKFLDEPEEGQRQIKIDVVREMERVLRLKPLEGRAKVAILEPADKLVPAAAHALLKILEEPPPATHLVLIAADASQLLGTLRSRCQWVRFRPLAASVVEDLLKASGVDEESARRASVEAGGSVSAALKRAEDEPAETLEWRSMPMSELLARCETFRGKQGRAKADAFLRRHLLEVEEELARGEAGPDDASAALAALDRLRSNVSPQLVVEALLIGRRRRLRDRQRV